MEIDTNRDGVISDEEQKLYAERVLRDLSLSVDGKPLVSRLISVDFPPVEQIKEGLGQIQIQFSAALPAGSSDRKFILENHHQKSISVYLMNCLVPQDPRFVLLRKIATKISHCTGWNTPSRMPVRLDNLLAPSDL